MFLGHIVTPELREHRAPHPFHHLHLGHGTADQRGDGNPDRHRSGQWKLTVVVIAMLIMLVQLGQLPGNWPAKRAPHRWLARAAVPILVPWSVPASQEEVIDGVTQHHLH